MASPKVNEALAQIGPDDGPAYEALLSNIKNLSTPATITQDLKAIVDASFAASLGIVSTRAVLTTFISTLKTLANDDLWIAVGTHALDILNSSPQASSSFLDQAATLRELIAEGHEHNEDFLDAAKILAEIPLDSSQRRVSDDEKVRVWIRIVRNFLEVDDSTSAETYLNKLKNVIFNVTDPALNLHFKLSQARINDAKRSFLAASQSYHDISYSTAISEDERLHTLSMAIKCAILAPAGPNRSRALGRLYKDERAAGLEEFGILEKMFLDRLLAPAEVDKFAQGLAPHQLALTADGTTVLAKAVVEHNLLGASRLYTNIDFDRLGVLLGLDGDKAEETTALMIEQGRLVGRIDQIDRVIWFEGGEASGEKGSGRAEVVVGKEMRRWDANVQSLAEEVENVTNALQKEFPEFVAVHLVV
ncbi:putative cop9 signalosome complex subunit 4 protein [Phaeoacremonium minimum UCRPA7]|uniref:COP9 signalosome complex subunit 4 n=1 Tax=Phaeoacremonium minimum (strain UCR-PA7) TaxID=1286976 RepID=R8BB37_PHAM7|nr:putative cop9 signalosome complex subunit 4 protein [Phaeoacremonium minimum UCRPA7]EON96494.1 putative cop9 signalosome complex subunit 4 protein [Phaeoacremonium minimum UCRPA7]